MPSCRNCGARLSKFDNDICPVCGTKNPLQGVSSETIEITSQVDLSGFKAAQKVVRRRKTMLLLSLVLGFTGASFFYIKKKVLGLVWLLCNVLVIAGIVLGLYLGVKLNIAVSIVIPVCAIYLANAIVGLAYFYKKDLKDGEGEFVV